MPGAWNETRGQIDMAVDALKRRAELRNQSRCRFVEVDEFITFLTSRRQFERADDPVANLRGLRNPSSGEMVFLEAEKLSLADVPDHRR